MQTMPEFVRDGEADEVPVRRAASANLTGWETVIFQVAEEPEEPEVPEEPASDSVFSTAALAP
jgi:hypothetical protein